MNKLFVLIVLTLLPYSFMNHPPSRLKRQQKNELIEENIVELNDFNRTNWMTDREKKPSDSSPGDQQWKKPLMPPSPPVRPAPPPNQRPPPDENRFGSGDHPSKPPDKQLPNEIYPPNNANRGENRPGNVHPRPSPLPGDRASTNGPPPRNDPPTNGPPASGFSSSPTPQNFTSQPSPMNEQQNLTLSTSQLQNTSTTQSSSSISVHQNSTLASTQQATSTSQKTTQSIISTSPSSPSSVQQFPTSVTSQQITTLISPKTSQSSISISTVTGTQSPTTTVTVAGTSFSSVMITSSTGASSLSSQTATILSMTPLSTTSSRPLTTSISSTSISSSTASSIFTEKSTLSTTSSTPTATASSTATTSTAGRSVSSAGTSVATSTSTRATQLMTSTLNTSPATANSTTKTNAQTSASFTSTSTARESSIASGGTTAIYETSRPSNNSTLPARPLDYQTTIISGICEKVKESESLCASSIEKIVNESIKEYGMNWTNNETKNFVQEFVRLLYGDKNNSSKIPNNKEKAQSRESTDDNEFASNGPPISSPSTDDAYSNVPMDSVTFWSQIFDLFDYFDTEFYPNYLSGNFSGENAPVESIEKGPGNMGHQVGSKGEKQAKKRRPNKKMTKRKSEGWRMRRVIDEVEEFCSDFLDKNYPNQDVHRLLTRMLARLRDSRVDRKETDEFLNEVYFLATELLSNEELEIRNFNTTSFGSYENESKRSRPSLSDSREEENTEGAVKKASSNTVGDINGFMN